MMVSDAAPTDSQVEIRELAERLIRGEITPDEYFAAVERRAHRLVEEEAGAGTYWKRAVGL